jgi:hypothetical protein
VPTVGKVDEHGNVAEDLPTQILDQRSVRLTYDPACQEACPIPSYFGTKVELQALCQIPKKPGLDDYSRGIGRKVWSKWLRFLAGRGDKIVTKDGAAFNLTITTFRRKQAVPSLG